MESVLADLSINISEFKKNPTDVLRRADNRAVAVLSNDKIAFYMVPPILMEALVEEIQDADLTQIARERSTLRCKAVAVDVDELERAALARLSAKSER